MTGAAQIAVDDRPSITEWVSADEQLRGSCSAAVDPLEIAARLETHGVSSRVATETFGFADVFAAARVVFDTVPFERHDPPRPPREPMGGPVDLLRGMLYAAPALFFTVAVRGLSIDPAWWALPVGLTTAWGLSQGVAVLSWALRGRGDDRSDALLSLASLLATSLVCLGVAVAARRLLGGGPSSVAVAVGLAVYIAAVGVVLFHGQEWLLAACMVPAAAGSLLAQRFVHPMLTPRAASWTILASGAVVIALALRRGAGHHWRRPSFRRVEAVRAAQFVAYGLGCGLLTSVCIGFATKAHGTGEALVIAVWPLLLTLGLMEWHLRSFRSRAELATRSTTDLSAFSRSIRSALRRSVGTYVAVLVVLSLGGVVIAHVRHDTLVPLLLGTVGALGLTFFLALLVQSGGHIRPVLVCWLVTFTVLTGALLGVDAETGRVTAVAGITTLLGSLVVAMAFLGVAAHRLLASPLHN